MAIARSGQVIFNISLIFMGHNSWDVLQRVLIILSINRNDY